MTLALPSLPRPSCLRPRAWRRPARQVCVLAIIAGYALACFGVSVPRMAGKDRSVPFACAYRACGCMNADDCRTNCCCTKRAAAPQRACCQQRQQMAGQKAKTPTAPVCKQTQPAAETRAFVLSLGARQCHGQGADWLSAAAVLPAPPPVRWQPLAEVVGSVALVESVLSSPLEDPPVPPPRLAV